MPARENKTREELLQTKREWYLAHRDEQLEKKKTAYRNSKLVYMTFTDEQKREAYAKIQERQRLWRRAHGVKPRKTMWEKPVTAVIEYPEPVFNVVFD
jgi:hypothetical protein